MLETRRNLAHGALGIEGVGNRAEPVTLLDDVCKRGRAQLKSNVEEVSINLVIKITNDVWVVICIREKADFTFGDSNMLSDETFDGHCTVLEGALEDNSPMGTIT